MQITKFAQSCLIVEVDSGARLLIDAGFHVVGMRSLTDVGTIDAALYTHQHRDHFDPRWAAELSEGGIPIFANADVCSLFEGHAIQVDPGTTFRAADVPVEAHDLPHMPMVDGRPGPPNLGFVIDGRLLHPGDANELGALRADILAAPIAGPSLSARDAYLMVEGTGASRVIPVHYDHFLADPDLFAAQCPIAEVVVLQDGQTVTF